MTPQRRLIFQALVSDHNHPSAEDIYRRVRSALPDMSRTTVYNTLRELVDQGQLDEIDLGEGKTRYDTDTGHHHLICLSCHAVVDLNRDFPGLELPSEESRGYRVVRHQVTFYACCPDCQTG